MDSWPELRNQSLAKVVVLRKLAILHKIRLKTPLQNLHKNHTKWYLSKQRIFIHSFDPNHILHNQRNREYIKQNHSHTPYEHLWPSGYNGTLSEVLARVRNPARTKVSAKSQTILFCLFDPDHILRNQRNRHYIRKSLSNARRTAIAQWLYYVKCPPGSRSQPNLRLHVYLFVLNYTF